MKLAHYAMDIPITVLGQLTNSCIPVIIYVHARSVYFIILKSN